MTRDPRRSPGFIQRTRAAVVAAIVVASVIGSASAVGATPSSNASCMGAVAGRFAPDLRHAWGTTIRSEAHTGVLVAEITYLAYQHDDCPF